MEVVWPSEQSLSPAAFVTDSEAALMRALDVPVVKRENRQVNLARIDLVFLINKKLINSLYLTTSPVFVVSLHILDNGVEGPLICTL